MNYVERGSGCPAWDLHDHFAYASRPYVVNGDEYYFDQKTEPYDAFLSRMSIYGCVPYEDDVEALCSPPDFDVVIGQHDYRFGLSYGWPGSTFHQHCEWTIGGWRQDLTEDYWYYWTHPGYERQVANIEEAAADTERELAQLFARLERYKQTGWYQLQWPEVAGLMANIHRQWMASADIRASFRQEGFGDEIWDTEPGGRRDSSIGFEMSGQGWKETPIRFEISPVISPGISSGWQFNIFAPYSSQGECPWYEGIVFRSEHSNAEDMELQCPLPHSTPHRMRPTVRSPWDLWEYLSRECLPKIGKDARWHWSPPSFGW